MEEKNIPIDINAGKLLDWLISRRHCNKDWQKNILDIREKINNAIQDMPAHEGIAKLLLGTHIHYFHCQKIVEILKQTEADTKNLFGRYGSQRMKDWMEIIRLYEKDNIYLAEAAQMLIRNINFEIPNIKKQIQKCEQQQTDLKKKEEEYAKSENLAKIEYTNLCKQLGISGERAKKELAERILQLPEIYEKITKRTACLNDVVKFYNAFTEFTLGRSDGCCVPMVEYVIDKGNTTVYEWTYGEAPLSVIEPPLCFNVDDDDERKDDCGDNEIDFGDLGAEINDEREIDLDMGGNIDWGAGIEAEPVEGNIDFEISLEESGIVVESSGTDGGVATGNYVYTVLDNPSTRSDFIDQLFELEAFLKVRLYECKSDNSKNLVSISHMQEAAPILQMASANSIQTMLDNVQIIISEITDKKVQHLHNIKHSARYVDTLVDVLKQKLSLVEKMNHLQEIVREKQQEVKKQAIDLQPVLKLVIEKTKELQAEIEQDISKKYKDRTVHLTGGLKML